MPLAAFLLAMLAPASSTPINVTGHAWAPFISPMGEPFRAHTSSDDTLADWFYQADRNRDGLLTADEMQADADRFFAKLDSDHNGEIDPDELANYEYEVAPEIQVMSRTRRAPGTPPPKMKASDIDEDVSQDRARRPRPEDFSSLGMGGALQGGARYALLNIPEPVASADTDFNRGVTREEFRQAAAARFALLDKNHQGRLTLPQLEALPHVPTADGHRPKYKDDVPDVRIGNPLPTGP